MATIHRKSAKGVAEIETRAHRLAPRLRSLLILVDGRRPDAELAGMMPGAADGLGQLLAEGFIEPVAPPAPALAGAGSPRRSAADLPALTRLAVRRLTEAVGPLGEGLALRIERSRSLEELKPLLTTAQQMIASARGAQAAAEFTEPFRDL